MSHPRIDALDRASGRAKYAGDWKMPGMLYGAIIRSTVSHAYVRGADASRALSLDGVQAVLTCLDTDLVWNAGERVHLRSVFTKHVRFVGDCLGAVAATSRNAAREAAELVSFEYEELPAALSVEESMKKEAVKIWEDGNILGPFGFTFGDLDAALGSPGSLTFEREYRSSRVNGVPLEPATSLAWWEQQEGDPSGGERLTVVAATQSIYGCRDGLAKDLGLKPEQVRVIGRYKGGGFGNKNNSMNYDLAAALLSKRTGRPVMVEYSREEDLVGLQSRWSTQQRIRASVDPETRKLRGVEIKGLCDIGAYTRHIKRGIFIDGIDTYYPLEAYRSEIQAVYTNTPATGHVRAPTGPQSCFAMETLVDEICHELGSDPLEFRFANLGDTVHGHKHLTSCGLEECLARGAEAFGWKEKWRRARKSGDQRVRRGVGLAIATWHAFLGMGEAIVRLKSDGRVEVFTGVVDIGTGAKSTMAMIAAKSLNVDVESIDVVWGDTSVCPYSIGESGGRTTSFTGLAVKEAALAVGAQVKKLASDYLGEADVELANGFAFSKSKPNEKKIGVGEIMQSAGLKDITEKATSDPKLPEDLERLAFAAHFAEVEVDVDTGFVSVLNYVAAHDSGPLVNRLTSESQVKGAVVMGIGMSLSEKLLIDPNYGNIQNSSLMTYRLPNITSIPRVETIFVETEDAYGPKSLGEIPIVPVPAAIGNAIFNATGARLREIPFTPMAVLEALDSS